MRGAIALLLVSAMLPLAVHAAPKSGLASVSVRAPRMPTPVSYNVPPPGDEAAAPHGWGLFATARGRTLDLRARQDGWAEDPNTTAHEIEAGYGWRHEGMSAMVGYAQPDFGPKLENIPVRGSRGVLGLSFSLRR